MISKITFKKQMHVKFFIFLGQAIHGDMLQPLALKFTLVETLVVEQPPNQKRFERRNCWVPNNFWDSLHILLYQFLKYLNKDIL